MENEVVYLKKSQIKKSGWNPRTEKDKDEFQLLKASIDAIGIRVPLIIGEQDKKDKKYPLIAGERRYEASDGKKLIPCVIQKENSLDAKLTTLVENLVRENVNHADHERFISKIFEQGKFKKWKNYDEMSKVTGLPLWLIRNACSGFKDRKDLALSKDISDNITTGDLSESHTIKDMEVRKKLLMKRAEAKQSEGKSLLKAEAHVVQHVSDKIKDVPKKIAMKYLDGEISDVALEHARQAIKKGVPEDKIEFETEVNIRQRQSLEHMKKSVDTEMEEHLLKGRDRCVIHIGKGSDDMHLSKYRNAVEQVRKFSSNEIEHMIFDHKSKDEAIECMRYIILACSTILLQMGHSVPYARIDIKTGDIVESEDET